MPQTTSQRAWMAYKHNLRKREIEMIFNHFPEKIFSSGLEVGAGDGFQSTLLSKYVSKLVSTDYNRHRLTKNNNGSVTYMICDAEEIDSYFEKQVFDLVFSSNLLEHLPEPSKFLKGMRCILNDRGIAIHVMPSPFWKLCHIIMFYPKLFAEIVRRVFGLKRRKSNARSNSTKLDNNLKFQKKMKSRFVSLLLPETHGAYHTHFDEFRAFRKQRWMREFKQAGFEVFKVIKGPVTSGYGYGFDRLRRLLEAFGITSEYIYIATKSGQNALSEHFAPLRKVKI